MIVIKFKWFALHWVFSSLLFCICYETVECYVHNIRCVRKASWLIGKSMILGPESQGFKPQQVRMMV